MRLTYRDGVFIAIATYEEKEAVKEAGFRFHRSREECKLGPANCTACRLGLKATWWTKRPASAARLSSHADDLAKAALEKHIKAVEMSRALDADIQIPVPPRLSYFGYQKAGIAYMAPREGTLLGDEQGTGKTIQVIGVINLRPEIENVLVVCPATIRLNWLKEAKRWLIQDHRKWNYHVVDDDEPIHPSKNFVIVHYNRVTSISKACDGPCGGEKRKELTCPTCRGTGNGIRHPLLCAQCGGRKHVYCEKCKGKGKLAVGNVRLIESLANRKWDLIAVDEAHFLKNPKAKRTKAILGDRMKKKLGLADLAKQRIFMTGTPIPNRPIEIWPVVASLAPKEFGNFRAFAKRYCDAHEEWVTKEKKVFKMGGASNLPELQERLRSTCLIRRLKVDVLKDLPPKQRQIIPLSPTPEAKKLIAQEIEIWEKKFGDDLALINESINLAEADKDPETYDKAVDRLKYIQRIAFVEMAKMRKQVAVIKIPQVIEHIKELFEEGTNKIVCFAHHHEVIERLTKQFGEKAVTIYGQTSMEDRQKAVDAFQDPDSKIKLFIGGITAAGIGITLTASANVVFAELDWTPGNLNQAEDRCHRIGQANFVLVQHLVLDGSLDARMAQMLVEKQEIADRALDKSTDVAVKGILLPRPEVAVEPVALWKKTLLKEALSILAKRRDPTSEGGHGFSQFDANLGQKFATMEHAFSDRQAAVALALCRKYRRQIPSELLKKLSIEEPPKIEVTGKKKQKELPLLERLTN